MKTSSTTLQLQLRFNSNMMRPLLASSRRLAHQLFAQFSSTYQVIDVKNSHLIFVKDPDSSLPFMSEITTQDGQKGVALRLSELNVTVVGMYHPSSVGDQIEISKTEKLKDFSTNLNIQPNRIYDINLKEIAKVENVQGNTNLQSELPKQGRRHKLITTSPILSICQDMYLGDFIGLAGPRGSQRTTNAMNVMECFVNSRNIQSPLGIYLNTNQKESANTCLKAASLINTVALGRGAQSPPLTSVGVYMLAVKTLMVAKHLKNSGRNVMLVIDNLHEILANQWTILQSLKLPISPFSILNELYSSSSDNNLKTSQKGSLTSIAINNPEDQDVLQQYATFGNNSKYLRTLCEQIQHPLTLQVNNSSPSQETIRNMRKNVNRLLKQKQDSQLLTKLKLNKDQPWDQYYVFDAQWWSTALKKYRPESLSDLDLLLWFIDANIQEDYCAHWNIPCIEAYKKYKQFLEHPADLSEGKVVYQLESFVELAKQERIFQIFKKDYLA